MSVVHGKMAGWIKMPLGMEVGLGPGDIVLAPPKSGNNNNSNKNRFTALFQDYPGESVPEETITHPPSCSLSNLYQLLPSTVIHSILFVQITCLAIFLHNLFPCPIWSASWSGALHLIFHTFLHPTSVFFFAAHARTIATCFAVVSSIPSFSLNSLLGTLSFTLKPRLHDITCCQTSCQTGLISG